MYRVMAGKEDIGPFISRVVLSITRKIYKDGLGALTTGLKKIPAALRYEGAFDPKRLISMCQLVAAKNGGVKPVIAGSAVALMNVLPDSASGFRMEVSGSNGVVTAVKDFYGYEVVALDQAYAGNDKLVLADDELFVVSPVQDKLVKIAISDSLSNTNQFYENADLTQNYTTRKLWDAQFASSAAAGHYKISG